ncbi:hypothetical protein GCM10008090_15550 [Arenicella chitinivorans]|uniref:Large extracellular alpha-helical protein n=1 Tax=Arenicella chitinivorans TaxID=1329800 RepID=A0A918RP09_9GAMM|nr:alpha-2-macroglobulin family protein [Arenicella chitinivorans]GHA06765.1 hypothetical protein GCM10008090_15550 [Arenicella chitinivorans]
MQTLKFFSQLLCGLCLSVSHGAWAQATFDSATFNQAKDELALLRVTPSGEEVPVSNRQIVFKFNQPVVAVGDMQRESDAVPISITPKVNCAWLWLDTSSLACQLDKADALQLATRYTIHVNPGIQTLDGVTMPHAEQFSFTTIRPAIQGVYLHQWTDAARPVMRVQFNQPVSRASVLASLRLRSKGNAIDLQADNAHNSDYDALFLQATAQSAFESQSPLPKPRDDAEPAPEVQLALQARRNAYDQARYAWNLSPVNALPAGALVRLQLTAGLRSVWGAVRGTTDNKVHTFSALPKFEFLGVECRQQSYTDGNMRVTSNRIQPRYSAQTQLRESDTGDHAYDGLAECLPLQSAALVFSTPVSYQTAKAHLSVTPDLAGGIPDYDPWSTRQDRYLIENFFNRRFRFGDNRPYRMVLPEVLKAYDEYKLESVAELRDELHRTLDRPISMSFLTAHRLPNYQLDHRHAVFEKTLDTELPVTVTNLDELVVDGYTRTTMSEAETGLSYRKPLPEVEDIAYAVPLGVRAMLGGKSGLVTGTLSAESTYPGLDHYRPEFVAQVTPFQVHLKFGHFKSMVWVTSLQTGKPVAGVKVRLDLDRYSGMTALSDETKAVTDVVITDRHGVAELPGQAEIDPTLKWRYVNYFDDQRLILKLSKGADMAVLPLDNSYLVWSNVWPQMQARDGYLYAWGTTAQGVYKIGDTVQYKIYVRNQSNDHWVAPPSSGYALQIIDPKGQVVAERKALTLSEFGAVDGEFTVPETAPVGWYQFNLRRQEGNQTTSLSPMRVLISDFTPAPFRVTTELNGDQFGPNDMMTVDSVAAMHAGGPYADAEARVTAILRPRQFSSSHPVAKGFRFAAQSSQGRHTVHQSVAKVNPQGELVTQVGLEEYSTQFGRIMVETAVRDERGKYVASSATADFIGRDRFVGLKNTKWVHTAGKIASTEVLVVDAHGTPVDDTPVSVVVEYFATKAARVKSAGSAYLTQYTQKWVNVAECQLTGKAKAQVCEFTPSEAGSYRVTAQINDTHQRSNSAVLSTWVTGKGHVVWGNSDRELELIADAEQYRFGDTANILVKNPYPGAQALITVERYGVRRQWTQVLDVSTPIIQVPIEGDDYPGIYVSVLLASPRVDRPLGENQVDLGKPAFKLGYTKLTVNDDAKELVVSVSTNEEIYRPREKVTIELAAEPKIGKKMPVEVALVVIDEAVFDLNLSGKRYYDPLHGFNHLESLGVMNYNLLMRLVGRQKFEKKGASPGGGGSEESTDLRNIMKFVAYWNPALALDKRGRAEVDFTLPDNLTGWRVFAMAVSKDEKMGLGEAQFKVNRPTELRPVMPNQLTASDTVQAGFSVMNRTDKARTLNVDLRAAGSALAHPVSKSMRLDLEPYQRAQVWMDISADQPGEIAFYAQAGDAEDKDAIEHHLTVGQRRSLVTAATYGTTTQASVQEPFAFPSGIYSDVGGLSVHVSPSVIANISGAFEYLRDYPYFCWEQRLSKGLAAAQYTELKAYLPASLAWENNQQLVTETLASAASFQAPNGGMTYWINDNRYVSPYLSAYTAMGFVWLRDAGYDVPETVEQKLHAYLKTYLRRDETNLTNQERSMHGMRSSIRAVALAALAARKQVDLAEVNRFRSHWENMDLFGKAHFLQAATELGAPEDEVLNLTQNLLSYSVQSGGKFQFNETLSPGYAQMLHTPLRSNCAILTTLLDLSQRSAAALNTVGDIPFKQVRAISQTRGNRAHWENTQENLFCLNALIDYSRLYERTKPDFRVTASMHTNAYGSQSIGAAVFSDLRDTPAVLADEALPVEPGLSGDVVLDREGDGRVYYSVRMRYAKTEDAAEPVNAGLEVRREYSVERDGQWQLLSSPMQLRKGELVRVDLFVSTPTARHFVVIDDPVPGGLEPVNRDLATSSVVDANKATVGRASSSWWYARDSWQGYGRFGYSFYHQELRHNAARFYSDYLPAGDYYLSYTAQAIAGGTFSVMPLKVEEMYDPDVYGMGVPASLKVEHAE